MPSLFFNADLVQAQIDGNGGAIAFVDANTAWVSGPMAQSNWGGIQAIIDKDFDLKRRSGATVEAEKMAIVHFTRYRGRIDSELFHHQRRNGRPKGYSQGSWSLYGLAPSLQAGHRKGDRVETTRSGGSFYSHRSSSGGLRLQGLDVWV
jgi:hypothetical protein